MFNFRRKGAPGSGATSCIRGDKQIKENPDIKWNKKSDDLCARSHPAKLAACEGLSHVHQCIPLSLSR